MATETTTTGRVHEGWLEKEGSWMKSWKNRYCILDTDKQLSYYTDQNLTEKKGVVDLNGMTEHKERDDPNKMQFGFEIVCKDRHWFFKTSTRQDAIEWIGAITRCTDQQERETRLGWSIKDKVEVFSQSKDKWCLGYIKRVDRHVVCVSYSVGEQISDQLTKEVRVFDAAIRKPSPEALRKDEEKKKTIAKAKQEKMEEEGRKKTEEEDTKKREAEEARRAKVGEEQAKARGQEEERRKTIQAEKTKQAQEESTKKDGGCPAYEGMKITAYWRDTKNEAHNGWYGAILETVNTDNTLNILFNDGHRRANVIPEDIEELKEWAVKIKAETAGAKQDTVTTTVTASTEVAELTVTLTRNKGTMSNYWTWSAGGSGHNNIINMPVGAQVTFKWTGDVGGFYLKDMSTEKGDKVADGNATAGETWTPAATSGQVKLEVWKSGGAKGDRSKQEFTVNVTEV